MERATVTELEDRLLARIERESMVFEVNFDDLRVTDVTLEFVRDDEKVGSIYNDFGTSKTMAHLETDAVGDFIGVEVPKSFVAEILAVADETDRLDETLETRAGYEFRVLRDAEDLAADLTISFGDENGEPGGTEDAPEAGAEQPTN